MLSHERVKELVTEAAAASGYEPQDFIGQRLLSALLDAERAGATIYWGCLPDRDTLRGIVIMAILHVEM